MISQGLVKETIFKGIRVDSIRRREEEEDVDVVSVHTSRGTRSKIRLLSLSRRG